MTIVALVTATPMNAKAVIVVGNPSACPSACERWLFAYRVKSGMLRLSVAQYPTLAVSAAGKSAQNTPWPVCRFCDSRRMCPSPPPFLIAHKSSSAPPPSSKGADQLSRILIPSVPLRMIAT